MVGHQEGRSKHDDVTRVVAYLSSFTEDRKAQEMQLNNQYKTVEQYCRKRDWPLPYRVYIYWKTNDKYYTELCNPLQSMKHDITRDLIHAVVMPSINVLGRNCDELIKIIVELDEYGIFFASVNDDFDNTTTKGKFAVKLLKSIKSLSNLSDGNI